MDLLIAVMDKFIKKIYNILLAVFIVDLIAFLLLMLVHIFYRYALNNSLAWSEEVMRIMLVWFLFTGVAFVNLRREHVNIVILLSRLSVKAREVMLKVIQVFIFAASASVCVSGIIFTLNSMGRIMPATQMSMVVTTISVPIIFGFITLVEFRNMVADLTNYEKKCAIDLEAVDFLK